MNAISTVLAGLLLTAVAVSAQTPPPQPAPAQPGSPQAPAGAPGQTPATPAAKPPTVEPQGYTYGGYGRRDPFVSLLRRGTDTARSAAGARPAGVAGLEASEITLKGTIQSRSGFVALVQGADNRTYIVRSGDKLLDGTIQAITADTMVILQQVNDPLSLEKQREVRKVLRQTDEVK